MSQAQALRRAGRPESSGPSRWVAAAVKLVVAAEAVVKLEAAAATPEAVAVKPGVAGAIRVEAVAKPAAEAVTRAAEAATPAEAATVGSATAPEGTTQERRAADPLAGGSASEMMMTRAVRKMLKAHRFHQIRGEVDRRSAVRAAAAVKTDQRFGRNWMWKGLPKRREGAGGRSLNSGTPAQPWDPHLHRRRFQCRFHASGLRRLQDFHGGFGQASRCARRRRLRRRRTLRRRP